MPGQSDGSPVAFEPLLCAWLSEVMVTRKFYGPRQARKAERTQTGTGLLSEQRGCFGKAQFPSKSKARGRARVIVEDGGAHLYPYKCRHCGRWHLTKKRQRG